VRLRRPDGGPLRVGHRGAALLGPENSLAAVEAALAAGVDAVEIDVVPRDGRLVIAHSRGVWNDVSPGVDETLALLADADVLVVLDVKRPGLETDVVAALDRHGLVGRALVTSWFGRTLRAVRRLEPELTIGLAYPYDRTGYAERVVPAPVVRTALGAMRRALPARIGRMLRRSGADAAVLHHLVLSPSLVARCRARDAAVLAWTVNDDAALRRVAALDVDGVITDDPRIFHPAA